MKAIKFSVAAAAALAVSAFAAEGDVLKPYGVISGETGLYQVKGAGQGVDVRSYASRFGLKGAHALDGGLTAVYQVEVGFNTTNGNILSDGTINNIAGDVADVLGITKQQALDALKTSRTDQDGVLSGKNGLNDGSIATRNSFVGIAGGFGTFLIGNHDTPYKLAARGSGTVAHGDSVDELKLHTDRRLKGAIAYVAPADAVGGSTIALAIVPAHTTDGDGKAQNNFSYSLGAVIPVDPVTIGAGVEVANVSIDRSTAAALGDTDLADDAVTETSFFVAVNAKLGDQFTVGVAYEHVGDNDKVIANKGKVDTILVPLSAELGDGLFVKGAIRHSIVSKKGAPVAAGSGLIADGEKYDTGEAKKDNQTDVGLSFGKKWGKDFEAYVGAKFVSLSDKSDDLAKKAGGDGKKTGFDLGVGLRVSFN
jgi:predicted porin